MNVITYTNHERNEFFFSRSHDDNWGDGWVVCTARLPMKVVPRKGIEDGFVRTLQQYVAVFHATDKQVENPIWAIDEPWESGKPLGTAEAKLLGAIFGENDERA
tara:strand:+ start:293 stop:604 length:312 start_codon:yes stop_codon:yes gene_type:complete